MILIFAAITAIAAVGIAIYLLSPAGLLSPVAGGNKEQGQDKSETMQDFQRWETIEKCFNGPSTECDKQMITVAQTCQNESLKSDISCTSEKLASYLKSRGLVLPK